MKAYIDSSCFVAIAGKEKDYDIVQQRMQSFTEWFTSTLTEAEVRGALMRGGVKNDGSKTLHTVTWVHARRRLTVFIERVLATGVPLKGADLWHLAIALHMVADTKEWVFFTLDGAQKQAAFDLGFLI